MSDKDILESDRVKGCDTDDPNNVSSKLVQEPGESNFVLDCSDDENYEMTIEDKIKVYKRIAEGDLELSQKLIRVRSPSPDLTEEKLDEVKLNDKEQEQEISEEKSVAEEFDFDSFTETSKVITPRRNIGTIKTPRNTQKRVAQWDKIMNDYLKHQKLEGEKSEPVRESNSSLAASSLSAKSTLSATTKKDSNGAPLSSVKQATLNQHLSKSHSQEVMEVDLSEEVDKITTKDL